MTQIRELESCIFSRYLRKKFTVICDDRIRAFKKTCKGSRLTRDVALRYGGSLIELTLLGILLVSLAIWSYIICLLPGIALASFLLGKGTIAAVAAITAIFFTVVSRFLR